MADSVYKIIELVGTSKNSWERAAAAAVKRASGSLRNLRIAEIGQLDMQLEDGKPVAYRARVKVSFKFDEHDSAPRAKAAVKAEPAPGGAAPKAVAKKAAKKTAKKAAAQAAPAEEAAAAPAAAPKKKAAKKAAKKASKKASKKAAPAAAAPKKKAKKRRKKAA